MNKVIRMLASLCICHSAGIIGSFFTLSSVTTWYGALTKPAFNPPSWVFGPVWFLLYTLMGVSLYLVWKAQHPDKRKGVILFAGQWVLNILWTAVFFGAHALLGSVIIMGMLLGMIGVTIVTFYRISRCAAWLLVPYFIWCMFAAVLNGAIYFLNA